MARRRGRSFRSFDHRHKDYPWSPSTGFAVCAAYAMPAAVWPARGQAPATTLDQGFPDLLWHPAGTKPGYRQCAAGKCQPDSARQRRCCRSKSAPDQQSFLRIRQIQIYFGSAGSRSHRRPNVQRHDRHRSDRLDHQEHRQFRLTQRLEDLPVLSRLRPSVLPSAFRRCLPPCPVAWAQPYAPRTQPAWPEQPAAMPTGSS